jgi:hypothetical protein
MEGGRLAGDGDGKKTSQQRAELDARDLRLKRGLIAKDPALTAEAVAPTGDFARTRR